MSRAKRIGFVLVTLVFLVLISSMVIADPPSPPDVPCVPTNGGIELCDNKDNNCDNVIDEGCDCSLGDEQSCGESNVGECTFGKEYCNIYGEWENCDAVMPTSETCNNGDDDDCDNYTDCEDTDCNGDPACIGGVCIPGENETCGEYELGICQLGVRTCSDDGTWGSCVGNIDPQPEEICTEVGEDPEDENCNGEIDEGCDCKDGSNQTCGTDVGECVSGFQFCENGAWGNCVGNVGPSTELCDNDGNDSDCDGNPNNGCDCLEGEIDFCGVTNVGECEYGNMTCDIYGNWGTCVGEIVALPSETCWDGTDDDCDGLIDEEDPDCGECEPGINETCGEYELGICQLGVRTCSDDGTWGSCVGNIDPQPEEICTEVGEDPEDENCNGEIDEGCSCTEGDTLPCGENNNPPCTMGEQVCNEFGEWGNCSAVFPTAELCDGIDNDCDTQIDENLIRQTTCGEGECSGNTGEETCTNAVWSGDTCDPEEGKVREICGNNLDDDCDGRTDEGCSSGGGGGGTYIPPDDDDNQTNTTSDNSWDVIANPNYGDSDTYAIDTNGNNDEGSTNKDNSWFLFGGNNDDYSDDQNNPDLEQTRNDGSSSKSYIWLGLLILILVVGAVLGYRYRHELFGGDDVIPVGISPAQDYVNRMKEKGFADDAIKQKLSESGYHEDDIKKLF